MIDELTTQEERDIHLAIQAMEAALNSLGTGNVLEAKDALWQALSEIKRRQ